MPPAEASSNRRNTAWTLALSSLCAIGFFSALYKYTTRAWFQEDDFAWLGLRLQVHGWGDLGHALFAPMAQGTIRPISERAFFLVFSSVFGLDAKPYRLLVWSTFAASLALLVWVAYQLTGSRMAGFWAPILWTSSTALAWPLTWTSAYNEVLASLLFLLSFGALLRYEKTGDWRWSAVEWASFLFGFGVLEINAMYPLIAILYALLFARRLLGRGWGMLAVSVVYTIAETLARPPSKTHYYVLHLDGSILKTLAIYWDRAVGPGMLTEHLPWFHFPALLVDLALTEALLSVVAFRMRKGDRIPALCLGWFLIVLAPFLPVSGHISDYYLAVPCIGLALLGAWSAALAARKGFWYRASAVACIAIYLACTIPASRHASEEIWRHSAAVKKLFLGVQAAHQHDPGKTIVLEGVGEELFWNGVSDHPFRLIGADRVYLTPETVSRIPPYPELANVADYTLPASEILARSALGQAVVYGVESGGFKDITGLYVSSIAGSGAAAGLPSVVNLGHPPMDSMLGPTWYGSEGDFRWMPGEATVRLGMPAPGPAELRIQGACAAAQVAGHPLTLRVEIDGALVSTKAIRDCTAPVLVTAAFRVAPGRKEAEVRLLVDHTVRVGQDQRDLGLAVSSIEVAAKP